VQLKNKLAAVLVGFCLGLLVAVVVLRPAAGRTTSLGLPGATHDVQAEDAVRRLYGWEHDYLLRAGFAGFERLPHDFVTIDPANLLLTKPQVINRLRMDVGRYYNYRREFDFFRRYGSIMVVLGTELVATAPDPAPPDAWQVTRRRFTEVWVLRGGAWKKVVRHASDVAP
jgi:hypothetical protein